MEKLPGLAVVSVAALTLAGCAHTVPALTSELAKHPSGPTVDAIVDHIACEVVRSDAVTKPDNNRSLNDYVVTVLLTLQVDDSADLTPSLGLTQPLKKPAVSLVTTLNADLGGARQRMFTSSYSFNVSDLLNKGRSCGNPSEYLYSLEGDLQINEIINDGLNVTDVTKHDFVIRLPANVSDRSGPSFGSKVQFVVTQSISDFGPVWTLKYFKGPGGSNGLLNGKRLDTDSVLITFAPKPKPAPVATDANKALEDAIAALTAAVDRQTEILNSRKHELAQIKQRSVQLSAQMEVPGLGSHSRKAIEAQAANLDSQEALKAEEVKSAEDTLANTKAIADAAAATKQSLDAATQSGNTSQSTSAAANASQQLQLNMLLQNLTIAH
jgi:hypothetical protein